jgi:hypothetical protein
MRARAMLHVAFPITVALVAAGCGSEQHHALDSYRSATYGYTIERPVDWSVVAAVRQLDDGEPPLTGGGGTDIFARHASTKVREMDLPVLVIGAQPIAATTHTGDWAKEVSAIVDHQKGCGPATATNARTVDGVDAIELSYPDCPPGAGLDHRWIALVHGSLAFQIVWFDASGAETPGRTQLDSMLANIHFGE